MAGEMRDCLVLGGFHAGYRFRQGVGVEGGTLTSATEAGA
jgi:hypothetical protein